MLEDVSKYFKSKIRNCDKDLSYAGFIFDGGNVSANRASGEYQLIISNLSTEKTDIENYRANFSVQVILYSKSKKARREEDFFKLYDKGIKIAASCQSIYPDTQDNIVRDVVNQSIDVQSLGEDNSVEVTLNFTASVFYKLEQGE